MRSESHAAKSSLREAAVSLALATAIFVAFALTSFLPPSNGVAISAPRDNAVVEQVLR